MIAELRTTKTANFYKLRSSSLSKKSIDELFRTLRANQSSVSRNHFAHNRESLGGTTWSAISFSYERNPSFLDESTGVTERVWGFMLLVEYQGYIAVFKSRLDLPSLFVTSFLERVNPDLVTTVVARTDSVFERIRLRNMSVSKYAMRSKTLEASDLANVVGPAGASRYVPQGYLLRSGDDYYSATPSTGRIAQRSDKIDYQDLISYGCTVIDGLVAPPAVTPSPFIRSFARALDLSSVAGTARATTFSVDVASLADALYEPPASIRLVQQLPHGFVQLTHAEVATVLQELREPFVTQGTGKLLNVMQANNATPVGTISVNKSRIALRSLNFGLSGSVEVERTEYAVGTDLERQSLRAYLDANDAYIVLFDDISLAYIDGTLFRDDVFSSGGGSFLRYFRTEPTLAAVTSEKGKFSNGHTEFDADSTFGVITRSIAANDDVLVCDDLNDEWADFIGLGTNTNPTRATFYHAKHGELSLGAGPFHISVSQAIKNLGRIGLAASTMPPKFERWRTTYNNDKSRTAISRVCKGTAAQLENYFEHVRTAPDTIRQVAIVTSSLSKKEVERTLNDIAAGNAPDPYFVQLYWLLMSFFSACNEVGAFGYVICQP